MLHIVHKFRVSIDITCKMGFKGTTTLFFITLAFLQTYGCYTEETIEAFYNIDLDKSGFATYEELCQALNTTGLAGIQSGDPEDCNKLWNSFDLNNDGKVTCQGMSFCTFLGEFYLDK